jgi:phosphoglycolate phosphatase
VLGGDGPVPRKPDPAGLLALMADAGVAASQTTLVGDSLVDWRTAQAAGVRACVARYGFGFEGFPVGTLRSDDLVVDHPSELPQQF